MIISNGIIYPDSVKYVQDKYASNIQPLHYNKSIKIEYQKNKYSL